MCRQVSTGVRLKSALYKAFPVEIIVCLEILVFGLFGCSLTAKAAMSALVEMPVGSIPSNPPTFSEDFTFTERQWDWNETEGLSDGKCFHAMSVVHVHVRPQMIVEIRDQPQQLSKVVGRLAMIYGLHPHITSMRTKVELDGSELH
jgi:hypothetical protein